MFEMESLIIALIVVLIALVSLSAMFSASETAYSSLNPIRLKSMAADGVKNADIAIDNHARFDKILTTILIGNNIVNVASSTLCTMLFTIYFGESYGVIYATVFMITILLVFGEVTPKTIAKRNPEIFAIRVAKIIRFATMIMAPVIWAFLALTRLISKKMGAVENHTLTEDELVVMIDEIEEEGTIEKSERDLIKCAIHFDDIRVNEIYTPRVDIVAASVKVTVEEMKELFIRTEFSRIPIYEETIDRIVGAIYSKDFFAQYVTNSGLKITDIIRPVKFVPENTSIATLLSDLQRSTIHMAIVLDNFGGTLGIVSMEDILEELVGEIWDESDDVKIYVKKEEDGSFTVLGDADMFDVMKEIGLEFNPGEDFENGNVSRFIYHKLEKIPKNGDSIELDNVTIVVKSMKSRRIKEARFIPREVLPEQ